jgi:D-alanyl-D-alanine carboxypeptidase
MAGLGDKVPIPPKDTINIGLSSATERIMLRKFGKPGALTKNCSRPTGKVKQRLKSNVDVGPFKVTGLDFAVESLLQIFSEVEAQLPAVFRDVKTAGMLCVRHRRTNPARFSNHSWGAAIDIFFGARVVPQGTALTHRGVLQLAPFFNRHGWYWGAEFSGDSVDAMHFEMAAETVLMMPGTPL